MADAPRRTEYDIGVPPQSEEEIAPILAELRRIDSLLDLRWNARCFRPRRGDAFDVIGRPMEKKWEGRWELVRYETDRMHLERPFAVIMTITRLGEEQGIPVMFDQGPYAPIGSWLIPYVQLCDAAQGRAYAEYTKALWKQHDRASELDHNHAAHQDVAEKVYRKKAGAYWSGGAQGKADPRTAESLWGRIKSSVASVLSPASTP